MGGTGKPKPYNEMTTGELTVALILAIVCGIVLLTSLIVTLVRNPLTGFTLLFCGGGSAVIIFVSVSAILRILREFRRRRDPRK
jgi:uncharacterized membrane protein YbhN (UPF0104 family)